jgi:hypothetical protein
MKAESKYSIDYSEIFDNCSFTEISLVALAEKELSEAWIDSYNQQSPLATSIQSITLENYTFLWDEIYERVVVAFGVSSHDSQSPKMIRDKSRRGKRKTPQIPYNIKGWQVFSRIG